MRCVDDRARHGRSNRAGLGRSSAAPQQRIRRVARLAWRGLREWCGDLAYERYLLSPARRRSGSRTLSAEEFYLEQLNRRYSRPNRCC